MTSDLSVYVVTGGAGFIGSHLVDALLADDHTSEVRVIDNFSSGREEHLSHHGGCKRLKVVSKDLLDLPGITPVFSGAGCVYHLAANPDARWGIENTRLDLEQETIVSYNVLEAMRRTKCSRILISSSGTVYGDIGARPVSESWGPCLPVSLYGAGKVASESLVSAFCGTFGFSGMILRFGNIVGQRTTHGVIFDFLRKLASDRMNLEVLGDGHQAKPYVYVLDLIQAMRHTEHLLRTMAPGRFDVFNVAPEGASSVRFIAETLLTHLGLSGKTRVHYGTTAQGWPGDVPQSRLDASKLENAHFGLPRSSDEAVRIAIEGILSWLRTRSVHDDGLSFPVAD